MTGPAATWAEIKSHPSALPAHTWLLMSLSPSPFFEVEVLFLAPPPFAFPNPPKLHPGVQTPSVDRACDNHCPIRWP